MLNAKYVLLLLLVVFFNHTIFGASEMAGNQAFLLHKMKKSFQLQVAETPEPPPYIPPHQGSPSNPHLFLGFHQFFFSPISDLRVDLMCVIANGTMEA